jgi:hypothetical protein
MHCALCSHADLTGIRQRAKEGGVGCELEVGVLEHDEGSLATEFESAGLDMLGAHLCDLGPDGRGARERDLADGGVGDDGGYDLVDNTMSRQSHLIYDRESLSHLWCILGGHMDNVDHARREAGVEEDLTDGQVSFWRVF